mmetsp:Transcript_3161/g.5566  ORF Transcript_3161/g.5566 Transcript_3161/m.5566 type:complete len:537 (-) Transcript_3161:1013-2623(-)
MASMHHCSIGWTVLVIRSNTGCFMLKTSRVTFSTPDALKYSGNRRAFLRRTDHIHCHSKRRSIEDDTAIDNQTSLALDSEPETFTIIPEGSPSATTVKTPSLPNNNAAEVHLKQAKPEDAKVASVINEAKDKSANKKRARGSRKLSDETRRRISESMTGKVKSPELRGRISAALRGRVPWNKGKKLSPETRAKMAEARFGTTAWNRGSRLSRDHRSRISASMANRILSDETRRKLQMARRRPPDPLVSMSGYTRKQNQNPNDYPLVDTKDIHQFVMLRRELQMWSSEFLQRVGRRPNMADIRRLAPISLIRKFERYAGLKESIRGLVVDVCGDQIPVRNQSHDRFSSGSDSNVRMIQVRRGAKPSGGDVTLGDSGSMAMRESGNYRSRGAEPEAAGSLSVSEFRALGAYRLMDSFEIHSFIRLRRELRDWLEHFIGKHGRNPELSDLENLSREKGDEETSKDTSEKSSSQTIRLGMSLDETTETKLRKYLSLRQNMRGLLGDVYKIDLDDAQAVENMTKRGEQLLRNLQNGNSDSS